jgi:[acyl-carrier-protein] S-malonyltransferase
MSQKAVFLFAGQGAQTIGMGKDLAETFPRAAETFSRANEILGFDLPGIMFGGPQEELTRTSRCQPALYAHGLVCLDLLKEQVPGLEMAGAAGLSLGEFTAHAAAGTFDFTTGLEVVAKRGRFMEEATDETEGSMAAMMGGSEEAVRKLAEACGVDVANYNAPGQIVISGNKGGIARALAEARENGIRIAKELDVAGAYHSRLMQSAQDKLAGELAGLEIREPSVPVVCNYEAKVVAGADEIRRTLEAQVTGSVRWAESMKVFLDQGQTQFIEFGPGGVLAGLMKRIDRNANLISVTDVPSLEVAIGKLNGSR